MSGWSTGEDVGDDVTSANDSPPALQQREGKQQEDSTDGLMLAVNSSSECPPNPSVEPYPHLEPPLVRSVGEGSGAIEKGIDSLAAGEHGEDLRAGLQLVVEGLSTTLLPCDIPCDHGVAPISGAPPAAAATAKETAATVEETAAPQDVNRDKMCSGLNEKFPEQTRVCFESETGKQGGMVARVTATHIMLALDKGEWYNVPIEDALLKLSVQELSDGGTVDGRKSAARMVAALNFESGVVKGMLIGSPCELVFGEGTNAYFAHISAPVDKSRRPSRGNRTENFDFACGDIVQWVGPGYEEGAKPRAAIVRVTCKPKDFKGQGRKLLILMSLTAAPNDKDKFFPGPWTSWERIRAKPNGAAFLTLDAEQMKVLDRVSYACTRAMFCA